jgi:multidrug efflux pump subunit AcrA (membrane-fusion protein)
MLRVFCCVVFVLFLFSCSDKQSEKNNFFTVKQSVYIPKISYNGVIRPACYKVIVSPADGHVAKIITSFGKEIIKGQDLIELSDSQINKDYIADIVGFLENKEKLRKAKTKLKAEKELYAAGVISKNELDDDQYNYEAAYIALLRSELALQKKSILLGLDFKGIGKLTLHDMQDISESISKDFSIHIKSIASGRWMSPLLIDQKSKPDVGNLYIGKKVEKGQAIGVIIDDACGLKVKLYVNHEQINLIKKDMKVTVHSKMFSGFNVLNGKVDNVSYFDVKVDDNDETKLLFPVEVIIPKIPEKLKSIALLGMKVQVFFKLKAEHQIRVPIKAVKVKNNEFFVTKIAKDGSKKDVFIKIGVANINDVEVKNGLVVGDKVVLYD